MPREINVKSVLNKKKKRDPWFLDDYTFNPYSSCQFNCLYCYIRGSQYGTNLEHSLSVKINAIDLLDRQLANRVKKNEYGIIVVASATDPYLRIEKDYQLTRQALQVILKHRFPIHIITKSELVERDFDLLHQIDREAILPNDLKALGRGTIISFSFSTVEDRVGQIFEPGAPVPSRRLSVLQRTVQNRFLVGVNLMPLLPYISDTSKQLHLAFSTFAKIGVDYILPATITLFGQEKAHSKTLMIQAIKEHYPQLEEKYQRFFSKSTQMPYYYRHAFQKKIQALCMDYGILNGILPAAAQKRLSK